MLWFPVKGSFGVFCSYFEACFELQVKYCSCVGLCTLGSFLLVLLQLDSDYPSIIQCRGLDLEKKLFIDFTSNVVHIVQE